MTALQKLLAQPRGEAALQKLLAQLYTDAASGLVSEATLRLAAQVQREARSRDGAKPR